jgi:hypothetical protein
MRKAINLLGDAGIVEGRKGSLTFFRWSNAQPPTLVRLGLWGSKIDNELLALTSTMPDLEGISLYETNVDDEGIRALAKLPKLRMLAVLPVERYEKQGFGPTQWSYPFIARRAVRPRITGEALQSLASVKTLESLDLQDAQVQSSDLALLASWPRLGSLGLPNTIDDETVKHLQACRRLSQLTLGNREITADEVRRLSALKSLRKLVLTCAKLSNEALEALSRLDTVQSIELIDCGLTDEHLKHLHLSPMLIELALPRNEIDGPGLVHLAKFRFKTLGLEFNNVRDETLKDVAQLKNVEDVRLSYCFGVTDEWHLVFCNFLEHIAFGFMSGFHKAVVGFWSSLPAPRLEAVGTVGHAVCRNGIEQLFVKLPAELSVTPALQGDQWLESLQGLERSFETDRTRLDGVFNRNLSHDRADEIVGQNVGPEFLPNEVWRLAAEDVHLQCLF